MVIKFSKPDYSNGSSKASLLVYRLDDQFVNWQLINKLVTLSIIHNINKITNNYIIIIHTI